FWGGRVRRRAVVGFVGFCRITVRAESYRDGRSPLGHLHPQTVRADSYLGNRLSGWLPLSDNC
ncbi:MAG: hypothetical protein ACRCU2_25600, partial [Planktothrix sp.]